MLCESGVSAVILTGATRWKIFEAIRNCEKYDPSKLNVIEKEDFTEAVLAARAAAKEGSSVLLSPACASFDAFPNFEVRGRHFKDLVRGL